MKKIIVCMIIVSGILYGCGDKGEPGPARTSRSYIRTYWEPTNMICYTGRVFGMANIKDKSFDIAASMELPDDWSDHTIFSDMGSDRYDAERNSKYDSICIANNDMSFNGNFWGTFQPPAIHRKIESIHVVSDADYDVEHPAGTYLDDIININFYSAYDFVKNNYSREGTGIIDGSDHMIENLAVFNGKKRNLVAFEFGFNFTKLPDDVKAVHRFTVTYTNEDGKVLTATSPVTMIIQLRQ